MELAPVPEPATRTAASGKPPDVEAIVGRQDPQEDVSPDDGGLVDEQRRQAEFVKAFASGMLATGTLTSTIENLERQFAEEFVDPAWSDQQAINIQTEFVNTESLVSYQLSNLECRRTMCKGLVRTFGNQPFEDNGVSLAVALSGLASIDLAKMHIQDRDAVFAQVFFARKDLIGE